MIASPEQTQILVIDRHHHFVGLVSEIMRNDKNVIIKKVESLEEGIKAYQEKPSQVKLIITQHWGEERGHMLKASSLIPTILIGNSDHFRYADSIYTLCLDYSEMKQKLNKAIDKALTSFELIKASNFQAVS